MNWKRLWEIARWEYLQKVRSKSFILSLILTPAFMVAFAVFPSLLIKEGPEQTEVIALIDSSGSLYTPLKQRVESADTLDNRQPAYQLANYTPRAGASFDSALARADRDVLNEVIEGAIVVRDSAGDVSAVYRSLNPNNFRVVATLENAIEEIVTEHRLSRAGIDTALYNSVSRPIDLAAVKVTEKGEDEAGDFLQTFFTAYIGIILFMLLILTTGQTLVRSLVEEKSNRIMELLVSSATPRELMWGKLIGLTGLGITQVACWGLLGLVAIFYLGAFISPEILAPLPLVALYLILGYFFYSAIFVGVGSLVTTEQEAQVVTQYLTMLLVAPMAFAVVVIQNPDASYIQGLSYVPVLTPTLMMLRVVVKMPSVWEILATVALMIVSTAVVIWAASKIFRTAILMYGKRPTMSEVMRWLRVS